MVDNEYETNIYTVVSLTLNIYIKRLPICFAASYLS